MTIFHLMVTNVISISDTNIFYPQLLRVKVPVRPPSIASIQILNKLRSKVTNSFGPQRRMIFPFNRLILSMVAPRLMRFQFDIMLHSIISELVKKIVIPIMGSITGANNNDLGGRPALLSHLLSQVSPQIPLQSPSPPFDIKQMIIKTQNAIQQQGLTLQNAIRMNGMPSTPTSSLSMATLDQLQNEAMSLSQNSMNPSLQYNNLANFATNDLAQQNSNAVQISPQDIQYFQRPNMNSIEPIMATKNSLPSNQLNFMPNVQLNSVSSKTSPSKQEKQYLMQPKWSTKSKNSSKKQVVKTVPQYQIEFVTSNNSEIEEESMTERPEKENESHNYQLNYVDTVVPSYGNQLSTQQINDYSMKENDEQHVTNSQFDMNNDKTKQEINDEIERASRWNDILVNMDKYNAKRRSMRISKLNKYL